MSAAAATALTPSTGEKSGQAREAEIDDLRWRPLLSLPCQLTVELTLPNVKVPNFLALRAGSVLGTDWRLAQDIPLRINGTLIAWGEFEGAGKRLAVRLTELA